MSVSISLGNYACICMQVCRCDAYNLGLVIITVFLVCKGYVY